MRDELPSDLARLREVLPAIVADMERHVPYASALATRQAGTRVAVNHREQHVAETAPSQGVTLTAFNGAYLEELALDTLAPDALAREARAFAAAVATRQEAGRLQIGPGAPLTAQFATPCQTPPAAVPVAAKFDHCRALHARLSGGDPRIVNALVNYDDGTEYKVFANRTRCLSQAIVRTRLLLVVFMAQDERLEYSWLAASGTGGFELTTVADAALDRLWATVRALLTAERIAPGLYDVVAAPRMAGVIAHEAFGHGVELDMFLKGRARAQEYLGKAVASPLVTLVDDPTVPGSYGSYFFDDEGQPAAPTVIIADGIFQRGLTDLNAATRLGVPRSANGRRESFARKVYARMSNTFFRPGTAAPDELIRSLDHGIYLEDAAGGMEDPKGWGMQVTGHVAREVRHGQFTGRVFSPVTVTGYVPEILGSVSAVGRDFSLDGGGCGKGEKEFVPVASGGPHLRLKARLS